MVDEVTFKARHLLTGDSSSNAAPDSEVGRRPLSSIEREGGEEAEVWLDESERSSAEEQRVAAATERSRTELNRIELEEQALEEVPTEDEELFIAAEGEDGLDEWDQERESRPKVRPSMDSLGEGMARAMLVNASGGSADDDPLDDVDPLDASLAPRRYD